MRRLLGLLLLSAAAAQEDPAKGLLDDDPEVRVAAAGRLATPEAIPALLDAIFDEDNQVARAAIDALGRIGPKAREAAPALRLGAAARPFLAEVTARALKSIGEGPGEPVKLPPATADLVNDPRPSVRMPAIWALTRDPAYDALFLRMLGDPSVRRRRIAAERYYGSPEALHGLLAALDDKDTRVRRGVLSSLSRRSEALPRLVKLLEEDDPALADAVSYALASLGPEAVPPLVKELRCAHARCRSAACHALGHIGRGAAPAVPALVQACFDEEDQVRGDAISALRRVGADASEAVPYIAELAELGHVLAQQALVAMRGEMPPPPPSPPDLASLRRQLADPDPRTAGHAAFDLGRLGASDPETLDALAATLSNPTPYARRQAAHALVRIGAPSVAVLARAANDGRGAARRLAAGALPKLATAAPDAVLPVALGLVGDDDPFVRREAIRAVGIVGKGGRAAVAPLLAYVRGGDRALASLAAWALSRLRAEEAVPDLLAILDRPRGDVQDDVMAAIRALGDIGSASAIPALVAEARRPDDTHFSHVLDALVGLGAPGQAEIVLLIRDETGLNRRSAINALMGRNLQPPGLKEALDLAMKDPDPGVRETAILAAFRAEKPGIEKLVAAVKAETPEQARVSRFHEVMAEVATVAELLAIARNDDARVRWCAWLALGLKKRGDFTQDDAARALPLLLEALDDTRVAHAAAAAAGSVPLGSPDPRLLRFLVIAPDSRRFDVNVAERIGKAIREMGPSIVPALAEALRSDDERIRAGAAAALEGFGAAARPAVPALREVALADPGNAVPFARAIVAAADLDTIAALAAEMPLRPEFGDALVAAGRDALPHLDRLRQSDNAPVRRATVLLFPRVPDVPLDWILSAAGDEDDPVACAALGQLGKTVPAEKAIPVLAAAARDDALRATALRVLASRGADAMPTLQELAADSSADVRVATVDALGGAGAPALGLVAEALKDKEPKVRAAATSALRRFGADAAPALPAVRELLNDPDARVRELAAGTLGHLKDKDAVPALAKVFAGRADRNAAGHALAMIGAAEALARFVAHTDETLKREAQALLAGMRDGAVPDLAALVGGDDAAASHEAAGVLARIGDPAVATLADLLKRKGAGRDAAWALGSIGSKAFRAVPDLVEALDDADPQVAAQAAWALGQMGPAAKDALPALERLYEAKQHRVIVADAMRKIRGS